MTWKKGAHLKDGWPVLRGEGEGGAGSGGDRELVLRRRPGWPSSKVGAVGNRGALRVPLLGVMCRRKLRPKVVRDSGAVVDLDLAGWGFFTPDTGGGAGPRAGRHHEGEGAGPPNRQQADRRRRVGAAPGLGLREVGTKGLDDEPARGPGAPRRVAPAAAGAAAGQGTISMLRDDGRTTSGDVEETFHE